MEDNNYGYCYILDFCDCTICEIKLTKEDAELDDAEALLAKYGCSIDSCSYMYSDDKLDITEISPIENL